jgi:hypothetical protein
MTAPVNAYFGSDPTALMSHPDLGVVVVVTLSAVPFYQLSGWVLFDGELVVTPTVSGTGVRVTVKTASYTLAYEDAGSAVEMNSATATTVTVPANIFQTGHIIEIAQVGAGQVTIAAGAGVQLRTPASLTTRTQYSTASIRARSTTEFIVAGDLL